MSPILRLFRWSARALVLFGALTFGQPTFGDTIEWRGGSGNCGVVHSNQGSFFDGANWLGFREPSGGDEALFDPIHLQAGEGATHIYFGDYDKRMLACASGFVPGGAATVSELNIEGGDWTFDFGFFDDPQLFGINEGTGNLFVTDWMKIDGRLRVTGQGSMAHTNAIGPGGGVAAYLGQDENGFLLVDGKATVFAEYLMMGYRSGVQGDLTISDPHTEFILEGTTSFGGLEIARDGAAFVRVQNGGYLGNEVFDAAIFIASEASGVGELVVTGIGQSEFAGDWASRVEVHDLIVGGAGKGTLRVENGGTVLAELIVAEGVGGRGEVVVEGNQSWLYGGAVIGVRGEGSLVLRDGATVETFNHAIGYHSTSVGSVLVTGSGSQWIANETNFAWVIAVEGEGELTVQGGGGVLSQDNVFIAQYEESRGSLRVRGEGSQFTAAAAAASGEMFVGGDNLFSGGEAEVRVEDGGLLHVEKRVHVWRQGRLAVDGASVVIGADPEIATPNVIMIDVNGELSGTGVVEGDVVNAGTISPGPRGGTLRVDGGFESRPTALFQAILGGAPGEAFSQLSVSGDLIVDGWLSVVAIEGFNPSPGSRYQIARGENVTGSFSQVIVHESLTGHNVVAKVDATQAEVVLVIDPLIGDLDLDNDVDRADIALFTQYFGVASESSWLAGDFDFDGATTLADLALLQAHFGQRLSTLESRAVPEPSGVALAAAAMVALTGVVRRQRRNAMSV